jgi:signal transduction histidine kinase
MSTTVSDSAREETTSGVRVASPAFQPLRSQQVDVLLDRAGSLLTHSLDLSDALGRLGNLLVPQFADWCNIFLLDEQEDEWRLVLTGHADPALEPWRDRAKAMFSAWKNSGSLTQRLLSSGEPFLLAESNERALRELFPDRDRYEFFRSLGLRSALYLPLELDGKPLGSLLLLVLDQDRARYQREDVHAARRLATFVAAVLRNAKLWGALQSELGERKRVERSLRANTAAMRTLAAGLGHDIGNLLQPLRLRLDSLSTMQLPRMAVADLKAIGGVVGYLQRLTSGLRLLAGDPGGEISDQDLMPLANWWRDVEALMKDALPPGVSLHAEMPPRLPPVRMPASALTHVIFNLVQNAGIGTQGRSHATVKLWAERLPRRRAVRIGVEDNGPGMDEEAVLRCFDPFYASLKRGASSLGLPMVRALVRRAGGEITVKSRLGEGTSFIVTVPLAERRLRPRRSTSLSRVARLTVDDERTRERVSAALQTSGFYVDETEGLLHGEPQIWITDLLSTHSPDALLEFIVRGTNRLVIVVGGGKVPTPHPRIHVVGADADSADLNAILAKFEDTPRRGARAAGARTRSR